jgi:hypothetical protein
VEDDIEVFFSEGCSPLGCEPFVEARWKVHLSAGLPDVRFSSPLLWYALGEDIVIEMETAFHLNGENRLDYVRIDNWLINGRPFKQWPEVNLSGDVSTNLKKIKNWVEDIDEWQTVGNAIGQAGLLAGFSDTICQMNTFGAVDGSHVAAMMMCASVLSGGINALWLQQLERRVPGGDATAVLQKTFADFAIAGTTVNSAFLVLVPLLTAALHGTPLDAQHQFDGWTVQNFCDVMKLEGSTFTPYNLLAFRVIPPPVRPLTAACVSAVQTIVLSFITLRAGT